MKKILCVYHSRDLDGWCSAAIIGAVYYKEQSLMRFLGWDYVNELPDINIFDWCDELIMVDVSFPPHFLNKVMAKYLSLKVLIIDHHKTTIDAMNEYSVDIQFYCTDKFAACELTWFFHNTYLKVEELTQKEEHRLPDTIKYLGLYDSFRHKSYGGDVEKMTMFFQYAARAKYSGPNDFEADFLLKNKVNDEIVISLLSAGKDIFDYLVMEAKQLYNSKKVFEVFFDGHLFLMINRERFNPINFGIEYHKYGAEGFGCFWYDKGRWVFSLYNDDGQVDVSEICKKRGGGGHRGAAGFVIDDINKILKP